MAIETQSKLIDGVEYSVTQLPARRALKLKAKLIKSFGSVFASFISNGKDPDNLAKAIQLFSQSIDENQFESIIVELLSTARKRGHELTPSTIDTEFAGDIAGIYKVSAYVIEVNYANFFTMMGIGSLFQEDSTVLMQPEVPLKRDYTRT